MKMWLNWIILLALLVGALGASPLAGDPVVTAQTAEPLPSLRGQVQCFTYDDQNRLTRGTTTNDSDPAKQCGTTQLGIGNYDQSYNYDANTGNLSSKAGTSYGYNDSTHEHAVTHLGGVQKYWYDANGNQVTRMVGSDTYDLTYDAENRLVEVKKNNNSIAIFVYDGDGNRVKSTLSSVTTAFIGNHTEWEVNTSSLTRYFYAGSSRVAMRKNNTVYYLLSDHLGSTSITTDQNGQNPAKQYYLPWGEVRYSSGSLQTKYTYTGQYSNVSDFGLMYYNARWYDNYLIHWIQPDTIIPDQDDPLSWDRYAYVLNNPVKYTDPSGHCPWCIVIGAIAGAAVGYGSQVYSNYQNGVTGADAWLTNISGEVIAGSTLIGATVGLGVGVVSVVAGGGAVTAGSIAAGTGGTAAAANTACGGDLCTDETQKVTTSLSASLHTASQVTSNSTTAIQPYYPPRLGFNGLPQVTTLLPGEVVDRYGSTFGSFLSPAGTPLWARSLPPGVEKLTLNTYQVMKPIENVLSGTVSPYFGQIGGGIQYYIGTPYGQNVQSLINSGHLLQIIQQR